MTVDDRTIAPLSEAIARYAPTKWADMPDLELYMDQVITYMKRQLVLFQDEGESELITPSIINNYVKAGVVPRPINKRYTRPHLASLTMACVLKRVLPIKRVKQMTAPTEETIIEAEYESFCEGLRDVFATEAEHVKRAATEQDVKKLALMYALRASADCLIADRLMSMIDDRQADAPKEPQKRSSRRSAGGKSHGE